MAVCSENRKISDSFFDNPQSAVQQYIDNFCESDTCFKFMDNLFGSQIICFNNLLIKDENLMRILLKRQDEKSIENEVLNYYFDNNYEHLNVIQNKWNDTTCIAKRLPILNSCINLAKRCDSYDTYSVIIPTLLAQLSGLYEDIWLVMPKDEKAKIKLKVKQDSGISDVDKKSPAILKKYKESIIIQYTERMIYNKIFAKCFQNSGKICVGQNPSLNRHAILHGIDLDYGNKISFIRTVLLLDFIIAILVKVSKHEV